MRPIFAKIAQKRCPTACAFFRENGHLIELPAGHLLSLRVGDFVEKT
jgi:hypothetical protein